MMELEDSRQQLKFISEAVRAIRTVALMADEEQDWDTEGDVVRLIALATEPIMKDLDDVMAKLDKVIRSKTQGQKITETNVWQIIFSNDELVPLCSLKREYDIIISNGHDIRLQSKLTGHEDHHLSVWRIVLWDPAPAFCEGPIPSAGKIYFSYWRCWVHKKSRFLVLPKSGCKVRNTLLSYRRI